jgi:hypothetical protein
MRSYAEVQQEKKLQQSQTQANLNKDKTDEEISPIPEGLKQPLAIIGYMKQHYHTFISLKDLVQVLKDTGNQKERQITYHRPIILNPKQNEIINLFLDPNTTVLFLEGDQRTGKSTLVLIAITEFILNHDPTVIKVDMMAGKGQQCERLLMDLTSDPITFEIYKELITIQTNTKAQFWNNSLIRTHETTVADIKGSDAHIIWIDEFDVAIKQEPKAVFSAIMVLRARLKGNLKFVFSANRDKGIYEMVRQFFQDEAWVKQGVRFATLTQEDCPHLKAAGNDEFLGKFGEVLVGKGFVDMRLHNKADITGDIFSAQTLKMLMDEYAIFISQLKFNELPEKVILAIDPSLTGHPIGWFLGGYQKNTYYELDSGEFQFGDGTNGTWSEDKIKQWLLDLKQQRKFSKVVLESNTLGPVLAMFCKGHGIQVQYQNFQGDNTEESRGTFISVCAAVIEDHAFLFKSQLLYKQWIVYDPENMKKEGKYKGDLADATIHFIYNMVGGVKYMRKDHPLSTYSFVESNPI